MSFDDWMPKVKKDAEVIRAIKAERDALKAKITELEKQLQNAEERGAREMAETVRYLSSSYRGLCLTTVNKLMHAWRERRAWK